MGTILLRNLRIVGVDTSIKLNQRSALLGTARILRKVLKGRHAEKERKMKDTYWLP